MIYKISDYLSIDDGILENGYTKSKNPSSTITGVCKKKIGRNSYLGFGWRYKNKWTVKISFYKVNYIN